VNGRQRKGKEAASTSRTLNDTPRRGLAWGLRIGLFQGSSYPDRAGSPPSDDSEELEEREEHACETILRNMISFGGVTSEADVDAGSDASLPGNSSHSYNRRRRHGQR
jgi:hypothetical protein